LQESKEKEKFAAIVLSTPDLSDLAELRQVVRTELVGTRTSLALVAFLRSQNKPARQITAIRPQWVPAVEADPFNPERANGAQPPLEYFVPQATGHEVSIVYTAPDLGNVPFAVTLKDDVFVLYSRGSDNTRNSAQRVQNTPDVVQGADYLIWPPTLSLYRQYLADTRP
jgi:hypothetical protein